MGLMNKLRDKTHIILIILIVAFLATIVFEWGMDYLGMRGGEVMEIGSVNGTELKYSDFENQVNFAIEQQRQQTGQDPDDQLIGMIREQVWDQMVIQILVEQEIKRLGITVTNQEILNWVYNSPQTLPEPIKRNFVDSTGAFNMAIYQQALTTKTPEIQKFWSQVEEYLKQQLLQQKLQSVITSTVRVTEGEVMQKFKDDNIKADIDYVFLDVNNIQDNQVQISEEDLKAFYEKNKNDMFKRDEAAKLRYVLFNDSPNMDDTILTEKQMKAFSKDLKKFNSADSTTWGFLNDNSLNKFTNTFIKPNELSPEAAAFLFTASKDSISNLIKANDGFHIIRLIDSKDGEQTFVNASHILVNFGMDTNGAKQRAEQIFQKAKSGEDFIKLSAENSDDAQTKFNGGDLGWFTKGAMVKEFEDAVLNAPAGDIIGPIKTQYGFHIVKVKGRSNKEFKIADLKKTVVASNKTKDAARKRAEDFAFVSRKGGFDAEANKLGIKIIDIPTAVTEQAFIPGAGQNKSVSRFAVKEKKGTISDPIKINGGYAIYMIAERVPAGYIGFEEIKATTLPNLVKQEKKLDVLKQQADALKGQAAGNLNNLKASNPQLTIVSADSVTVTSPPPLVGSDFDFNNAVFKLQNGQLSDPIRTNRGYYVVQMKSITGFDQAKYQQDYNTIRTGLISQKKQSIVQEWIALMKTNANIVDNRDKFIR